MAAIRCDDRRVHIPTKNQEATMPAVQPIPEEYPRVIPYLAIDGAAAAIDFYVTVFDAKERMRMPGPDGKVGHAELAIGESVIMLSDEAPEMGHRGPKSIGGSPVSIMVYVEDVDAIFARALSAGATETQPLEDKFYGDRSGSFEDPWGHVWHVASHIEDVSPEEMDRRMKEMGGP
jgi:PhnB protein